MTRREKLPACLLTRNSHIKGLDGSEKIQEMMHKFRSENSRLKLRRNWTTKTALTDWPKSDVLKFILPNGWFAVRPSGTEPKIKFYFEAFADNQKNSYAALSELMQNDIFSNCFF